jgi:hypothetical protein
MAHADLCYDDQPHDWDRDPQRRGEGLACTVCGVTEAELEGDRDCPED